MSELLEGSGLDREKIDAATSSFRGEVVLPGDPAYDDARQVWNGSIDRRPAAVLVGQGVSDVRAGIALARTASFRWRCGAAATTSPASVLSELPR